MIQLTNLTTNGRSRPRLERIFSICAGVALVSGDHRRGIAGGEVKEAEDKKRDDRHHRNRHQDSTQDE